MDTTSVEQIAEAVEEELERLRTARPALSSRISRAENILVTHLSCKRAGIIKPRIRGGELVGYLVKGSGGAVYKVDPDTFSCSCPDYHRRGKGCKHALACYVLGRSFAVRLSPARQTSRRCDSAPKRLRQRHALTVHEQGTSSQLRYEGRECSRCLDGLVYDEREGWVGCERCEGTGRVLAFLYEHAERRLSECASCGERYPHRELIEVTEDHESLTWFPGDKLCRQGCAGAHGVL